MPGKSLLPGLQWQSYLTDLAGNIPLGLGHQFLGLRHIFQRFQHQGSLAILILSASFSPKIEPTNWMSNAVLDEVQVGCHVLVGEGNLLLRQELFEFIQNGVRYFEILGDGLVDSQVVFGEVEEGAVLDQRVLRGSHLGVGKSDVGSDSAAADKPRARRR